MSKRGKTFSDRINRIDRIEEHTQMRENLVKLVNPVQKNRETPGTVPVDSP